MLQNTMEGFFADQLYGGNKGMASWKMIGFPGARYDYRDHIDKHNQPYPHGPVSIYGQV
jgi:gluconate 2-dehydrogenase gamma chain